MKEKQNIEQKEENSLHPMENAYDRTERKMEERDSWMEQTAATLAPELETDQNFFPSDSGAVAAVVSTADFVAHAITSDYAQDPMSGTLGLAADTWKSWKDTDFSNSGILSVLESASMTPELAGFQTQLLNSIQTTGTGLSAISDYIDNLTSQWDNALAIADIAERSMAAQNFAVIRMLPDYGKLDLPRGSKRVLKSLTKKAAKKLTRSEEILFDPKQKEFYHRDSPNHKVTADQITVAESSQDLFADISLDELISFESELYDDNTFAIEHPVGKKIFEIIRGWNRFISFDDITYYHARKIEKGKRPFLDHEMLKAPLNVSSHGRYNPIGKSCYYICETKEGAVAEIRKHSGGTKPDIQVVGLRAIKPAKIIDLSGEIKGTNRFIEHLRYTVDNEDGKIIKEYLLPNFVASCCKRIGIDGIKYRSTGYNCYVLWTDDYFVFADGSREIISEQT